VSCNDRKRLDDRRFPPTVVAETDEVLRAWGIEVRFARCSYCAEVCFNPGLLKRKYRRKQLPTCPTG
jgi:hypothetical protein